MKRFELWRTPLLPLLAVVLLLNDFLLKPTFHNWLTGKLSDFAGLAAATIFLVAIWPRHVWRIGVSLALLFTFWKSPWSQGAIDLANAVSPIRIGRTVDWSDLVALAAVGLVCMTADRLPLIDSGRLAACLTTGVCLFAFAASSVAIRETIYSSKRIAAIGGAKDPAATEAELRVIFDAVAARHGLKCRVRCGPLSLGVRYIGSLDIEVSFDSGRRLVFYALGATVDSESDFKRKRPSLDGLQAEIERDLQMHYPGAVVGNWVSPPPVARRGLAVRVTDSQEGRQVEAMVRNLLLASGLKDEAGASEFSPEALVALPPVGPSTMSLRVVIGPSYGIGSSHPWFGKREIRVVGIEVNAGAPGYAARQEELVSTLRRRLETEYGKDRVSSLTPD